MQNLIAKYVEKSTGMEFCQMLEVVIGSLCEFYLLNISFGIIDGSACNCWPWKSNQEVNALNNLS